MGIDHTSAIARELGCSEASLEAVAQLLEGGHTVPFLARYRKEATGGMGEATLRQVQFHLAARKELEQQRASLLEMLESQGKLTPELRDRVDQCSAKEDFQDIQLLFKPKRGSPAAAARAQGLEPLAEYLWGQDADAWSLEEHVDVCINPEKGLNSRDDVLRGAIYILAEAIGQNLELRKILRERMWLEGAVVSKVVPAKLGQKTKFTMYYDRREPVTRIPSHRVLAIRRGSKEGILTTSIEVDHAKFIEYIAGSVIRDRSSVFGPILELAIREAYRKIILPSLETEVRGRLKDKADSEAIRVFQENLSSMLLAPPAGAITVLGLECSRKSEFYGAVVDRQGNLLEETLFTPPATEEEPAAFRQWVREVVTRHHVEAVALGSGTAVKEMQVKLSQLFQEEKLDNILVVSVSDAGAATYSTSRVGREEFPSLQARTRIAVTLARRLQDPLSELVKVDPKSIGVGQYQHDVNQKELHRGLLQTIESCVSYVGVDPNNAPASLLRHVAGVRDRLSQRIVSHREANGPFLSRMALLAVPGMEGRAFMQSAGFLRLRGGENPLDRTSVHPESYPIVEKMASSLGITSEQLLANSEAIARLKPEDFVTETAGLPTIRDICEALLKVGQDPRKKFAPPKVRSDVSDIKDLKEGSIVEGTVTNVTNFGAFVDVGVNQDGLVHLSQMSNRFIRDPREAVHVGDVVQVKVLSVEVETKRIGLSMKALLPPPLRRRKKPRRAPVGRSGSDKAVQSQAPTDERKAGEPSVAAGGERPARSRPQPVRMKQREPRARQPGTPQKETGPKPPEPTLSEKIAILRSKFRGIS